MTHRLRILPAVFTLAFTTIVEAESLFRLPEPLTLESALATASNEKHPALQEISLRYKKIQSQLDQNTSRRDFRLDFEGRIREVGPSDKADPDETGDNAASLILRKPLYDFGLNDSLERQLELGFLALDAEKTHLIQQRQIKILRSYFDVLQADNQFITENENLAIAFIRFDNEKEKQILGSSSEIDVLRLQSEYEKARQSRYQSEHKQRFTREILALTMGYADQIPSQLEQPAITIESRYDVEVDTLVSAALKNSSALIWREMQTLAIKQSINAASQSDNGGIDFEFEVSEYERESITRDEWRATILLNIPLYSTSSVSKTDLARANYESALNELLLVKSGIRLRVLELWQQLQQSQLVARGYSVEEDYRELYLDRSRAEYELEFKTDLGDAMVEFSRTRTQRLAAEYEFEFARRQLIMLVGDDVLRAANN